MTATHGSPRGLALLVLTAALGACAAGDAPNDVAPRDASDITARDTLAEGGGDDAGEGMDVASDAAMDGGMTTTDARPDAAPDVRPDVPIDTCVPTEVCNGIDDNCNGQIDETGCPGHLLITEIVAMPNEAEYIEIYNPTSAPVDLADYYLTDTSLYPRFIASSTPATADASDFVARFPAGATIPAGAYQTVATGNPGGWSTLLGAACPTYHLQSTATLGACTTSQAMRVMPVVQPSIGMTATLTNTGEPVTLFYWDGRSDLVRDVDYVYYGAPTMMGAEVVNPQVDKSMLSVDGPDADDAPTGYLLDTPPARQSAAPVHALSAASVRCASGEGMEVLLGGNGLFGHNETSEDLAASWRVTTPTLPPDGGRVTSIAATPNAVNVCP